MSGPDRRDDLLQDARDLRFVEPALSGEPLAERLAVQQLHREAQGTVGQYEQMVDLDDVAMLDRGNHLCLAKHAIAEPEVSNRLDGEAPSGRELDGRPDLSHPA